MPGLRRFDFRGEDFCKSAEVSRPVYHRIVADPACVQDAGTGAVCMQPSPVAPEDYILSDTFSSEFVLSYCRNCMES